MLDQRRRRGRISYNMVAPGLLTECQIEVTLTEEGNIYQIVPRRASSETWRCSAHFRPINNCPTTNPRVGVDYGSETSSTATFRFSDTPTNIVSILIRTASTFAIFITKTRTTRPHVFAIDEQKPKKLFANIKRRFSSAPPFLTTCFGEETSTSACQKLMTVAKS